MSENYDFVIFMLHSSPLNRENCVLVYITSPWALLSHLRINLIAMSCDGRELSAYCHFTQQLPYRPFPLIEFEIGNLLSFCEIMLRSSYFYAERSIEKMVFQFLMWFDEIFELKMGGSQGQDTLNFQL